MDGSFSGRNNIFQMWGEQILFCENFCCKAQENARCCNFGNNEGKFYLLFALALGKTFFPPFSMPEPKHFQYEYLRFVHHTKREGLDVNIYMFRVGILQLVMKIKICSTYEGGRSPNFQTVPVQKVT